jgi:hypothetical protein
MTKIRMVLPCDSSKMLSFAAVVDAAACVNSASECGC